MRIFSKLFSLVIIFCLIFSLNAPNFVSANTPVDTTQKTNSTYYSPAGNRINVYSSYSMAFMGAEWSSSRKMWGFNYRFAGTGSSRNHNTGSKANLIRIAAMDIKGTSNISNLNLWTSSSPQYIGSAPESSGSTANYSAVASSVVGLAITALNNLGLSYAWSAAGLISAFRSKVDSQTTNSSKLYRSWNFTPDISDTGQFFWFIVDVPPNKTTQFSHDYLIFGPGYELLSTGLHKRNLTAGSAVSSSSTLTANNEWNPGLMSKEEKQKYGVIEISREEFAQKSIELNISERSIKEFESSNEEVFYYATNFEESVVVEDNEVKNLSLTEEINAQIDRSQMIVRAFSGISEKTLEDKQIIEKNEKKISELQDLLSISNSISETDERGSMALKKELTRIVDEK